MANVSISQKVTRFS